MMNQLKQLRTKTAAVLQTIFGYGIFICLFVGGLSFFGYLVALIIGGETAGAICHFIHKGLYPYLVYLSSAMILLGLLKMYLLGEVALNNPKKKK